MESSKDGCVRTSRGKVLRGIFGEVRLAPLNSKEPATAKSTAGNTARDG